MESDNIQEFKMMLFNVAEVIKTISNDDTKMKVADVAEKVQHAKEDITESVSLIVSIIEAIQNKTQSRDTFKTLVINKYKELGYPL